MLFRSYSDVANILNISSIDNEINLLIADIESSKGTTDEGLKKITENNKKKLKALESLKTNLGRIENISDPVEVRKTTYLKKAFKDYFNTLLEEKNNTALPSDLDEAYRIFTDYYALNDDKNNYNKILSDLYDPNNFINLAERERTLLIARDKRRVNYFNKAFKKYAETSKIGIFLKTLANAGFVIDLKYLKALEDQSFENLKNEILNNPDIKFRDLNSNKLFGSEDPRFNNIKTFISEFEQKTTTKETVPSNITQKDSTGFSTDTTEDEDQFGSEDIENVSEFTQTVVRRAYDDYLKSLREVEVPKSFEEFVASKKGAGIINAITTLQAAYDAITDEAKPEFTEWLRINSRTPLVYDALNRNNVTFSDIFIQQRDENQYNNDVLEEGESIVSPGYNGVFITKITGVVDNVDTDVYFVKTNQGRLAIEAAGTPIELMDISDDVFTDLKKAEKAQKAIGDYLANNKKQIGRAHV